MEIDKGNVRNKCSYEIFYAIYNDLLSFCQFTSIVYDADAAI